METFWNILGLLVAFILTTFVGYGFWYVARGHSLKERRQKLLKQEGQKKNDAPRARRSAKKTAAEEINEMMGYDFIPVQSIPREKPKNEEHDEMKDSANYGDAPKAVPHRAGERSWSNSHNPEFQEQQGKLGISSNPVPDSTGIPETTPSEQTEYDGWPEYTPEEVDSWEEEMKRLSQEDAVYTEEDESSNDEPAEPEDNYEAFGDLWDSGMEQRDKESEEIRKKSLDISKMENEGQPGSSNELSDDEIDELMMTSSVPSTNEDSLQSNTDFSGIEITKTQNDETIEPFSFR